MRYVILFLVVPVLLLAAPSGPPCSAVKSHVKTYHRGQPLDAVHSKALKELIDILRGGRSIPNLDHVDPKDTKNIRLPLFTMELQEIDQNDNEASVKQLSVKRRNASGATCQWTSQVKTELNLPRSPQGGVLAQIETAQWML